MKPRSAASADSGDLFRAELATILNPKHELILLADRIDWSQMDQRVAPLFANEGRPATPTRLMVGLHYLKHAFDLSDEAVCTRWVENPYWQFFCGERFLQHDPPIDPSGMTLWRKRVGTKVYKDMLELTLNMAVGFKLARPRDFEEVSVDTTVQEKNIAHPTDARLYDTGRRKLVAMATDRGIKLRQTYARVGPADLQQHGRYCHAKQFKRARKVRKRLKNYLGRTIRDLQRQAERLKLKWSQDEAILIGRCLQVLLQGRGGPNKLYSLHEPEVQCIAKGKAHKRYEFGSKVGIVSTLRGNWISAAVAFEGNPYDGHTLSESLCNANLLTGRWVKRAVVDKGYRKHDADWMVEHAGLDVLMPGQKKRGKLTRSLRKKLKRRNAVEPVIGHCKSDHRMGRCYLKGQLGDGLNALGAAFGFNLRKVLKGLAGLACAARIGTLREASGCWSACCGLGASLGRLTAAVDQAAWAGIDAAGRWPQAIGTLA